VSRLTGASRPCQNLRLVLIAAAIARAAARRRTLAGRLLQPSIPLPASWSNFQTGADRIRRDVWMRNSRCWPWATTPAAVESLEKKSILWPAKAWFVRRRSWQQVVASTSHFPREAFCNPPLTTTTRTPHLEGPIMQPILRAKLDIYAAQCRISTLPADYSFQTFSTLEYRLQGLRRDSACSVAFVRFVTVICHLCLVSTSCRCERLRPVCASSLPTPGNSRRQRAHNNVRAR